MTRNSSTCLSPDGRMWGRPALGGELDLFRIPYRNQSGCRKGSLQAGPASAVVYRGIPGLLLGGLLQQGTSFAYTPPDRKPVIQLTFQPFFVYQLGRRTRFSGPVTTIIARCPGSSLHIGKLIRHRIETTHSDHSMKTILSAVSIPAKPFRRTT